MDLFRHSAEKDKSGAPLAERLRPNELAGFVGQEHLLGEGRMLRRAIESDRVPSIILWGPPGCGKTTLSRIVAGVTGAYFVPFSAVLGGVKEIRAIVKEAAERRNFHRERTILFIDEIHRFNKAQQDALLPHVERGTITLIGATTENPSFEVIAPLLSRCKVLRLNALEPEELRLLIDRALQDSAHGLGKLGIEVDEEGAEILSTAAHGDARRALNALEAAAEYAGLMGTSLIDRAIAEETLQHRTLLYDKSGEEHYNIISAFIKSMRGSDPDAAVYWLVRMLESGEDPRFLCRRMVIFASEDIGNADPEALRLAIAAFNAYELVGLPEAVLPLTQAAAYLASAPKSNAVLMAYSRARKDVLGKGPMPVPMKLRNAPTEMMKGMGYGGGYRYPHEFKGNYVPESYLPEALEGSRYYEPAGNGREAEIKARLDKWLKDRNS